MTYLKFCGFTSETDIKKAIKLSVDAIGFIHFNQSKRHLNVNELIELSHMVPDSIHRVLVVVNPNKEALYDIVKKANFDTVQFHGSESLSFIKTFKLDFPNIQIFKALSADSKLVRQVEYYRNIVDLFIIDTPSSQYGGTGKSFDWKLLETLPSFTNYLIAGGINLSKIKLIEKLNLTHLGYDISSGIEINNVKDNKIMKEIIQHTKGVSRMYNNLQTEADNLGFFGDYGGQYVPETLMPAMIDLKNAYEKVKNDPTFYEELDYYLKDYVGRETPLTYARSYSEALGGAKIYLKREDLNHTGAHKINNALGQALLAKRMGKKKLVAETGAGQHGVASATVAALFDMELVVFMGAEDIKRQQLNVFRMELLGAKVISVEEGQGTLSDAVNKALQYWVSHVEDTHYLLGSALGPHPFPTIVRDFQSVIGHEIKKQIQKKENQLPDAIVACIGGGSNAIGTFYPFIKDNVKLFGVEAADEGVETHKHALAIGKGSPGVLHGSKMYLIQNDDGQVELAHSISAGLDYPGIGPEHSYYNDIGRVKYVNASDEEAMEALINFSKKEGIIPAIESAHALSYVEKLAPQMSKEEIIVVTVSGRGDKDMETIRKYMNERGDKNE